MRYVTLLNGHTAYEWQIGPLYGRFTKLAYWWRVKSWRDDEARVTFWHNAMLIGWDRYWRECWDDPETPQ